MYTARDRRLLQRHLEFTSLRIRPPPLVFTENMTPINDWPDAWYKSRHLVRTWQPIPGGPTKKREILKAPPEMLPLARKWYNYPGHRQGSIGWHRQRFHYIISGSRVATILEHDRYKHSMQLFDELRGAMPNDPVNHHMIRGTKYEPVAMDYMSRRYGWVLLDMPLIHHADQERYPYLVVSLDRLVAACARGKLVNKLYLVECKCPWELHKDGKDQYEDQMQLQMECATSHMDDEEQRNECANFLWQYRDSAWSGSGQHEYRVDKTWRDPSWLPRYDPFLLDFDQRVRAAREENGITLEVYERLGQISSEVYFSIKAELTEAASMQEEEIEKVAREQMVLAHREAFQSHVTIRKLI